MKKFSFSPGYEKRFQKRINDFIQSAEPVINIEDGKRAMEIVTVAYYLNEGKVLDEKLANPFTKEADKFVKKLMKNGITKDYDHNLLITPKDNLELENLIFENKLPTQLIEGMFILFNDFKTNLFNHNFFNNKFNHNSLSNYSETDLIINTQEVVWDSVNNYLESQNLNPNLNIEQYTNRITNNLTTMLEEIIVNKKEGKHDSRSYYRTAPIKFISEIMHNFKNEKVIDHEFSQYVREIITAEEQGVLRYAKQMESLKKQVIKSIYKKHMPRQFNALSIGSFTGTKGYNKIFMELVNADEIAAIPYK